MTVDAPRSMAGTPLQDVNEYLQGRFDELSVIFSSWTDAGWSQDGWPRSSRPSPAEVNHAVSLFKEYVALTLPHSLLEKRIRWGATMMATRIWATDAAAGGLSRDIHSTEVSPFADYAESIDESWASRWRSDWLTGKVDLQFPQCVRVADTDGWLNAVRMEVPDSVSERDLSMWAGRVLAASLKSHLADCRSVAELLIEDICEALLQRSDYEPHQILCAATYFGGSSIYATNNLISSGLPDPRLVALSIEKGEVRLDFIQALGTSPLRMSGLAERAKRASAAALERKAPFTTPESEIVIRTVKAQQLVTEYREVKKLFGTKRVPEQVMREVEKQVQETVPTGHGTWHVLTIPLQRTPAAAWVGWRFCLVGCGRGGQPGPLTIVGGQSHLPHRRQAGRLRPGGHHREDAAPELDLGDLRRGLR